MKLTAITITTRVLLILALLSAFSSVSLARDISNEQRNAYQARQEYNKQKSAHESLNKRVAEQEKYTEQAQAKLNQLRQEAQQAKAAAELAKANLENKVNALNAVWDLRDKK